MSIHTGSLHTESAHTGPRSLDRTLGLAAEFHTIIQDRVHDALNNAIRSVEMKIVFNRHDAPSLVQKREMAHTDALVPALVIVGEFKRLRDGFSAASGIMDVERAITDLEEKLDGLQRETEALRDIPEQIDLDFRGMMPDDRNEMIDPLPLKAVRRYLMLWQANSYDKTTGAGALNAVRITHKPVPEPLRRKFL